MGRRLSQGIRGSAVKTWSSTHIVEKEVSLVHYGVVQVDQGTLFELILAANYLDIKVSKAPLVEITCMNLFTRDFWM